MDSCMLILSINALLDLDADNALVPHGIGGHARSLLTESVKEIERLRAELATLPQRLAQERASERERVAKVTEAHIPGFGEQDNEWTKGYVQALKDVTEGIRALGDSQ